MTRLRPAREADVAAIVAMGRRFLTESSYAPHVPVNPVQQAITARWLMAHGALLVAERGAGLVGMVGLALVPSPLSGELVASEAMWWVDPAHRGRVGVSLWRAAEAWAVEVGAAVIQMITPAGEEAVARMYERRGYVPLETTWQKRLRAA